MNDWLDDFQLMGAKLNEGEKTLMRHAMKKERERIIKLLEPRLAAMGSDHCMCHTISAAAIRLIKGENK